MITNKLFTALFLLGFALSFSTCSNSSTSTDAAEAETTAAEAMTETAPDPAEAWEAAKESFHDVMSATFHPAEEGDLKPLRMEAGKLASRASAWAKLPIPEAHQGKNLEAALTELNAGAKALGPIAAEGTDAELTEAIVELHDVFHKIVGLCEEHQ